MDPVPRLDENHRLRAFRSSKFDEVGPRRINFRDQMAEVIQFLHHSKRTQKGTLRVQLKPVVDIVDVVDSQADVLRFNLGDDGEKIDRRKSSLHLAKILSKVYHRESEVNCFIWKNAKQGYGNGEVKP